MMKSPTCLNELPGQTALQSIGLLVGMSEAELSRQGRIDADIRLESLPFALIHAALALAPWAECVIAPLVSEQFDALDLAYELDRAGYMGKLLVVAPALPRPEIVEREIRTISPDLQVELIRRAPH
ncbi:hypothetical protein [Actibacterium ureilyticum]|uniref:hypothetical protein n=1 Tax=Actibacterium ureilyticum TaxID=1590614 RepID=UPI000BAAF9B5|nr:hypothetical protein [Actibacterium ureilyticum]